MKKFFSILAVAWLGIMACAAQNDWAEIVFTQAIGMGNFDGVTFAAENSDFSFTCSDASNKISIDASTITVGTAEQNQTYDYRLKTSSKAPSLTFNIPADGIFRFAARSGKDSDETRTVVITQNDVVKLTQIVKESDKTVVSEELTVYPYYTVFVEAGTFTLTTPVNGVNFYSFAFQAAEIPEADHYFIAGSMTDWLIGMQEMTSPNGVNYELELPLLADSLYEFKVVKVNGTDIEWFGNAADATMTDTDCSGWWLNGQANVGLQTTKTGLYKFQLVANENHEISVIYPSEWDEIVFTAATAEDTGAFVDSVFTLPYSGFQMTTSDPNDRIRTVANSAQFGNAEEHKTYFYRMETRGSAAYMTFAIPEDGIFRFAARCPNTTDMDRTVVVEQDGNELLSQIVKDEDKSADNYFPYYSVYVHAGTVIVRTPVNGINFYGFGFKAAEIPEMDHYFIAGSMTDWLIGMQEMTSPNGVNYELELPLLADSLYEFKVVKVNGTDIEWFGNAEEATMTNSDCSGWWLNGQANVGLQTTKTGLYKFQLVANENHEISVIYPYEWDEIVFTAATDAGTEAFMDSVFAMPYSDFQLTTSDPGQKIKTGASNAKFQDESERRSYSYYLLTGSTHSVLTFDIPADGIFRFAAAWNHAPEEGEIRSVLIMQNEEELFNEEFSILDRSEDGYYPFHSIYVHAGTIEVTTPNKPVYFMAFAFKEAEIPEDVPSSVENTENALDAMKILRDGQILIIRGGKTFTMQGQEVK